MTSQQGVVSSQLLDDGARRTHGPHLHHGVLLGLAVEFDLGNGVLDGEFAGRGDPSENSHSLRRKHNSVRDQIVFTNGTDDVTTRDVISDLDSAKKIISIN